MNYDNPAARLLSLVTEGRKHDLNTNCRLVWVQLLDTNENPKLMSRLGKVMELPEQIIFAIQEAFPIQGNTWSHWESQINTAFMAQNLNANWGSFIGHIDDHSITYLRMASDLLDSKSNTKLLVDNEVIELRNKLVDLYAITETATMDVEVRKYVLRHLKKIINGIDEYKITGALPILESVEAAVGHTAIDKKYKSFLFDTELGKNILDTLSATANVVTVAVGLPQLTQAIVLLSK